ncbi:MAG: M48 family metallopeptidase [Planctomycetes bacterium]|nr:M48 family metallopeptidase [Planctomycetota bacterium]
MPTLLRLGETKVEVVRRAIKNVHLSVYPPTGRVRISAPTHLSDDAVRLFAIAKLGWIRRQQSKLREQERESPREFLDRESHYLWGRRYLLKIVETEGASGVEPRPRALVLRLRSGASRDDAQPVLAKWYRAEVRREAESMIARWEPTLAVKVRGLFVQQMKTRWGSCNAGAHTIRLNTELAKKPPECLEYIVVHEMLHLIEPTHGRRFVAMLDRVLPQWERTRDLLNRLPARHENWRY